MNHVTILGNLTRDPETRFTPNGKSVTEASIAVTERWKTESGEAKEKTAFIGLVLWGPTGEAFAKFHRKGAKALVEGKLVQEVWDDKDTGKKREKTKVQVEKWHFLPTRDGGQQAEREQVREAATQPRTATPASKPNGTDLPLDPEEDDVPF